ncbi:pecanex-like protein 1 isoform X2 [Mytilus californianus]|uniref:pecanex-like protein 1 isoform X2 n=1 Tax=Mytilus californianus TaxID=6549 RepID=UPI0022475C41|nr:pecanex-like protein 1 isoform X2 [Mytilus californianus]
MGSHVIDILRQGIWASLTGGWFYDPHQSIFSNTFHLYLWMSLLVFPLILHLTLEPSLVVWTIYCCVIGAIFTIIKIFNFRIHHMFDTSEVIEDKSDKNEEENKENKPAVIGSSSNSVPVQMSIEGEAIEMATIRRLDDINITTSDPSNSSEEKNSQVEVNLINKQGKGSQAPLAEHETDSIDQQQDDSLKQIHDFGTISSKEDSSDKDLAGGSQITTTAHVEINHHISDGELEEGEIKAVNHKHEDSDSDMSPHGKHRIKKRRKAVRRAQSDVERGEYYRERPRQNRSNMSLPQGTKLSEVKIDINDEIASGNMFRPRSECIIRQRKHSRPNCEMMIVELESSPKHARRDDISEKMDADDEADKPKYRRSMSQDGAFMPFKPKAFSAGCGLDLKSHSSKKEAKDSSRTKDCEEEKGSKMSKDKQSTSKNSSCDVPKKEKTYKKKSRPNSAGDIHKIYADKHQSGKSSKPKDLPLSHKQSQKVKDIDGASQKSSTVGLDWLFSTDSDSVSSGEVELDSHRDHFMSDTSSTMTNEGDSTIDTSPQFPIKYEVLKETDTPTPSTPSADELETMRQGAMHKRPDTPTPSSPSADELEMMRQQGAIPKRPSARPLPPIPKPTPTDESAAGSPSSGELPDPEDFRRKIMEILSDTSDNPEQMKKLFKVVIEAKGRSGSRDGSSPRRDRTASKSKSDCAEDPTGESTPRLGEHDRGSSDSKSGSPTESSALLPSVSIASAASSQIKRHGSKKRERGVGKSRRRVRRSGSPPGSVRDSVRNTGKFHTAASHDDTTEGALHWFQDENGKWYSYSFGENSSGLAFTANETPVDNSFWSDSWSNSSSGSGSTVMIDSKTEDKKDEPVLHELDLPGTVTRQTIEELLMTRRRMAGTACDSSADSDSSGKASIKEAKRNHFYKFQYLPKKFLKIRFDRLALLALLDRNLTTIENSIAVIIAVTVGAVGALVLSANFYYDFWVFMFCFVIAGCQYSVMKSVQPDAASPTHGYNRLVVFSRPFYFCVCCGLMLLLDYAHSFASPNPVDVYGMPFGIVSSLRFTRDLLKVLVLFFPVIFTVGLLPQVNTFIMYLFEQLDMHLFGGNATVSLGSSIYVFCRSIIATAFLYPFCYLAAQVGTCPQSKCEQECAQNAVFSILCAMIVAVSYHLSRGASDPSVLWMLVKDLICSNKKQDEVDEKDLEDPLPEKLKQCVSERLQSDLLISLIILVIVFAVHLSTAFSSLQPVVSDIIYYMAGGLGFIIHYIIPQLRKEMPWLCCSHPVLNSRERNFFEVTALPMIMWFEKMYVWMRFFERNVMYPVVFLCALTSSTPIIMCKFGKYVGPFLIIMCSLKLLRFAFSQTSKQYLIMTFTVFFFKYDYRDASETFLIDYFFISIVFVKFCDLLLKMKFILTYIAPWQITWGSAFHAFAQPFSVPHSAMLFLQAGVSAFFSTPLNPFLGSAIFITSYARPVKFWEKDYNTKRVDHSNTRLSSQLERNPGADDNNLNSIFYEHLTRSLQHSLCGDLMMGRWGNTEQGDCFIMASDYLNALVHVIEMGNGLVTFQLRGLEFRGTYCQQREVEAITEGVEDNEGFCCCEPGHLPHFLSLNAAFNQRGLAWEVVVTKYVLDGYSISDNNAASMVQSYETRKILISFYIKSIIYYTVRSPRLQDWLEGETILEALQATTGDNYVDVDPIFSHHIDEDYDSKLKGVSRNKFCSVYLKWIKNCYERRDKEQIIIKTSPVVSLCYCLSLLGRRALGTAAHNTISASADLFLFGLHALFKGDFRITSPHDEWVFADMELLRRVVAPAIRMALKLHQDCFMYTDEYEDESFLYTAISNYESNLVISHEADPQWRNAVLSNTPSLLALRHVFDEGTDEYKVIMLNKKFLTFRVVKVNRECVRGLWAGQQQELIFLRNRNPERGSIQNAKQALRNMINSSCDQPIGYPIYVSPLTTSYSSTHNQLASIIGGEFILANVKSFFQNVWKRMRRRCGATCAGSSSGFQEEMAYSIGCSHVGAATALGSAGSNTRATTIGTPTNQQDIALQTLGNRGSLISTTSSLGKPSALAAFAGVLTEINSKETFNQKVRIMDPSLVFLNINLGRRIDVQWPNEEWRLNGGSNAWQGWLPAKGMVGIVVHKWIPCHRETIKRSHVDKVILLVQIGDKYVPIADSGVMDLGAEV